VLEFIGNKQNGTDLAPGQGCASFHAFNKGINLNSRFLSLLFAGLLAGTGAARAGAVTAFDINGNLTDGSAISGTLLIDTTVGLVTGSSVSISGSQDFFFSIVSAQEAEAYSPTTYGVNVRNAALTEDFDFALSGISLVGYTGGAIESGNLYDLTTSTFGTGIERATLTASAIPEPGTLSLVGLSLVGICVLLQRKLA
jgi:hypothetical protein